MINNAELVADLEEAVRANNKSGICGMCVALNEVSGPARDALESALTGTIGAAKLSVILKRNGLNVAERQIRKHKSEEHTS
jgi:hypothetical protein